MEQLQLLIALYERAVGQVEEKPYREPEIAPDVARARAQEEVQRDQKRSLEYEDLARFRRMVARRVVEVPCRLVEILVAEEW